MRIHYIQHAPFEKVGVIEDWAISKGHEITGTHSYRGETLPNASQLDFLIVMGGPQSAGDFQTYPYLKNEVKLIQTAIEQKKLVVGFCLGAQLIGEALGARTLKSPEKEVGVYPVSLTEEGKSCSLFQGSPDTFEVIHWHNDMPGIPEGAEILAYSKGCPHQAFRYQNNVYAFQFHLEITKAIAQEMILNCPGDFTPSLYTQDEETFLSQDFASINQKMFDILDRISELSVKK